MNEVQNVTPGPELDGHGLSSQETAVVDPGGGDPEGGAGIFGAPLTFSNVGNVPVITDVARYIGIYLPIHGR